MDEGIGWRADLARYLRQTEGFGDEVEHLSAPAKN
jgi:hypothetical protein